MRTRLAVGAGVVVLAAIALAVVLPGDSPTPSIPRTGTGDAGRATPVPSQHAELAHAREDCSTRSEADFPGAFADPGNLVAGPFVLVGGAYTDASTVREYGGNKFPLLVEAGHTVTLRLAGPARRLAGLAYGPLPQGETTLRDTYRSVTFVACRPGRPTRRYSAEGPSGTYADEVNVTFWSGFVLTRAPACLPLDVHVDAARAPRSVELPLGRRCDR